MSGIEVIVIVGGAFYLTKKIRERHEKKREAERVAAGLPPRSLVPKQPERRVVYSRGHLEVTNAQTLDARERENPGSTQRRRDGVNRYDGTAGVDGLPAYSPREQGEENETGDRALHGYYGQETGQNEQGQDGGRSEKWQGDGGVLPEYESLAGPSTSRMGSAQELEGDAPTASTVTPTSAPAQRPELVQSKSRKSFWKRKSKAGNEVALGTETQS